MLRIIEDHMPQIQGVQSRFGRPAYHEVPFLRAFLARSFFRIPTNEDLRKRLTADSNLRQICGFAVIPSAATFSRRLTKLSSRPIVTRVLNDMVSHYHEGRIVGHISRDSTAITARGKPANKKQEAVLPSRNKAKRGRPRKGETRNYVRFGDSPPDERLITLDGNNATY